jgi:murein DD-endopeptidase MepM/ murein hydrolase activator NlpD
MVTNPHLSSIRRAAAVLLCSLLVAAGAPDLAGSHHDDDHAHQRPRHIEVPWADVDWLALAGSAEPLSLAPAIGNGPADTLAPEIVGITVDVTDLRVGPGIAYESMRRLPPGESLKLQARYQEWFKAALADGTKGWVNGTTLTIVQGAAEHVPVAAVIPAAPAAQEAPQPVQETPVPEEDELAEAPEGEDAEGDNPEAQPEDEAPTEEPPPDPEQDEAPQVEEPETPPTAPQATPPPQSTQPPPAQPAKTPTPTPTKAPAPAPAANRWVWPTRGTLTSKFGYRNLGGRRFHNGIDIANTKWTRIVAARGGTVTEAGWCSGYGFCVKIAHSDGFTTDYGHMASRPPVRAGQWVNPGTLIGYMGATYDRKGGGYATGVHLHFTVKRYGRAVNPLLYLP